MNAAFAYQQKEKSSSDGPLSFLSVKQQKRKDHSLLAMILECLLVPKKRLGTLENQEYITSLIYRLFQNGAEAWTPCMTQNKKADEHSQVE